MDFLLHESPVPFKPLYLKDGLFAVVDAEDYDLTQWCWDITWDKHGRKAYATRMITGPDGRRVKLFLHKEVCFRALGPPPGPRSTIGDHKDGQSLNCRRRNLRWATSSQNRQNQNGWYARQAELILTQG